MEKDLFLFFYLPIQSHPSLGDDAEVWGIDEKVDKSSRIKSHRDELLILRCCAEKPLRLTFSRHHHSRILAIFSFLQQFFVRFVQSLRGQSHYPVDVSQKSQTVKKKRDETKETSLSVNVWRPTDVPRASIPTRGRKGAEKQRGEKRGRAPLPWSLFGQDNTRIYIFFSQKIK